MKLKICIGYDSREEVAWRVCARSLLTRTDPRQVEIVPLIQQELRRTGLYTRPVDALASTEFSLTRFLTPALANYSGWAIFVDCDFLFLADIHSVLEEIDSQKAISVVQHDYRPTESIKMDGQVQHPYPRKNWSSFMVFNCDHPSNKKLTADVVNSEMPAFLHRLQWLRDDEIGALDIGWNYLEGWYPPNYDRIRAIHYTRGGPWLEHMQNCDFANLWLAEAKSL